MPNRDYYLPQRQLVNQAGAELIERANIPRSRFQGTWTRKTAFNAGMLVPIMVDEILPGDHMTYDVTAYVRMATPLFPIFDQQTIHTFFFFVPARLLWSNWEKFMGSQNNPTDSIAYSIPILVIGTADATVNSIFDHMGIPAGPQLSDNLEVNALPFRAYSQIWNQWFRDENLRTSLNTGLTIGDGPDAAGGYTLMERAKAHDYFTSALPWPQKFTAPSVPLAGQAPINGLGILAPYTADANVTINETGNVANLWSWGVKTSNAAQGYIKVQDNSGTAYPMIYADLSQATGVAINTLRQAFMVQTLLERDARGGTRYVEIIKSQFGVTSPDFRLNRPEYIGGGVTPINITPIAQTAPTTGLTVGALGGTGTAAGRHHASYAATEHGYILGLINVRTEQSYQHGIHRMYTRSSRYDFYTPALAQLGEQGIRRDEIYATGVDVDDAEIFGYQERWHEYRTRYSEVTGIMRSKFASTLDAWHLSQNYASAPTLNSTFINDTPPMSRVLAAGASANNQQYLADIMFRRTAVRPIPTFGTPATLGRF